LTRSDNNTDLLKENIDIIYNSFFIIDPRIRNDFRVALDFQTWEEHSGSDYEEMFFNSILSDKLHESLRQLVEPQRTIKSIFRVPDK